MTHVDVDLIVEVQYDVCTLIWQNKGSPAHTLHSGSPDVVVMMIMILVLAVRAVAVGPVCLAIQSFQVRCTEQHTTEGGILLSTTWHPLTARELCLSAIPAVECC
jgi:hypothetical protein